MQWKNILLLVAIFLLGGIAGFGLGNLYGSASYNAQLEQKVTDLQSRFQTANDNYLTLAREYNKLFALRGPAVTEVNSVAPAASPTTAPAQPKATATPAAKAATAPTTAATKATAAPTSAAKIKAEFKALAIDGTGPLEGPPPLWVEFTDQSTGAIKSWKWEFGDGETSTEQNPKHKYLQCPGDKKLCTVKLTVCGSDGCVTTTKPDYLWVSEQCEGC